MMPNILAEVRAALSTAAAIPDGAGEPLGTIHRVRSQNFVKALAANLRAAYIDDPQIAVLSKDFGGNRARFGLNELLYDILVCRTDTTRSANGSKELTVLAGSVLAVESEFKNDSRKAMNDFNKLVLCASAHKLFIGPRVSGEAAFLEPLDKAAAHCGGSVLAVLVPHPSKWKAGQPFNVSGYRWSDAKWTPLQG